MNIEFIKFFIKNKFISKNKEKRKFFLAGILNVFLTNLSLQIFLFLNLFNVSISTFLSQLINMTFGYAIYSKFIFEVKNFKNKNFIKKYILLMAFLWISNIMGIKIGGLFGINPNQSALLMIPCLAVMSFLIQKLWVFK
tara:strand:+ start:1086 stop:1502 length:417 start_codon:yes stop_codon:yes gene_type:complete